MMEQGSLVARGLIEFCEGGPPVHNYISLAGPHAGTADLLRCNTVSFFISSKYQIYIFDFIFNQSITVTTLYFSVVFGFPCSSLA